MNKLVKTEHIQNKIFTIRGMQVMLDRDLAELYGVETKVLNQAVKRNIDRFPDDFRFQINDGEKNELVTNCDRLKTLKHSSSNPYAFTEQGVSMLATVLKSKVAVEVSISIIRAFVQMRKFLLSNANILQRLDQIGYNSSIKEQMALIEAIKAKEREYQKLKAKRDREKQFNKKVKLNELLFKIKEQIEHLKNGSID